MLTGPQASALAALGAGSTRLADLAELSSPGRVLLWAGGTATVAVARPDGSIERVVVEHRETVVAGSWAWLSGSRLNLLEPRSALTRTAAGRSSREQVLAVDLDAVLICISAAAPIRLGRVERWLALAWDSGAEPVVVLTKSDLMTRDDVLEQTRAVSPGASVHLVSSVTGEGVQALAAQHAGPGRTLALVGSSGAGKSSLVNALTGSDLDVGGIRESDGRGRHTTVARTLIELPGGGVLLDTPGLRGLALHDSGEGLAGAYPEITDLALDCRFSDCQHHGEPDCAIRSAVEAGLLDPDRVARHEKLARELAWQESRRDASLRAERSKELRRWGRALKNQPHR